MSQPAELDAEYSEEADDTAVMKQTFQLWSDAVTLHNLGQYDDVMAKYEQVPELSSRMLYNLMCAYMKKGDIEKGIQCLTGAINRDKFLALAYFQRGILYLKTKRLQEALSDLNRSKALLRGNTFIDYKPLGLLARLYLSEILYNMSLVYLTSGDKQMCRLLLTEAKHDAEDHQRKWLQDALHLVQIQNARDKLSPRMVSLDRVFSPPKEVIANLEQKLRLRRAKVVTARDSYEFEMPFNFSRKMKEIKFERCPKPTRKNAIKRGGLRDRSASEVEPGDMKLAMRSSKSLTDLREIEDQETADNSGLGQSFNIGIKTMMPHCLTSPVLMIPNTELCQPSYSAQHSSKPTTPVESSKTENGPKSPLIKLKRVFQKKPRQNTGKNTDANDFIYPMIKMKGSKSTSDLTKDFFNDDVNIDKSDYDESTSPKDRKTSLGTVFGNNLSPLNQGLTLFCDAFTAAITPTEDDEDVVYVNENIETSNLDSSSNSVKFTLGEKEQEINICVPVPAPTDCDKSNPPETDTSDGVAMAADTQATRRRARPPPPSYPPPPLPETFTVRV